MVGVVDSKYLIKYSIFCMKININVHDIYKYIQIKQKKINYFRKYVNDYLKKNLYNIYSLNELEIELARR